MSDKSLSGTDIKKMLVPVFTKYENHVAFAYLFGSIAKNNVSPLSDIDIAVFLYGGQKKLYYDIKFSLYSDISRILKTNDLDVVVLNTTSNIMLLDEIIRYGTVLFDGDKNLREEYESKVLHNAFDFKEQRLVVMGV